MGAPQRTLLDPTPTVVQTQRRLGPNRQSFRVVRRCAAFFTATLTTAVLTGCTVAYDAAQPLAPSAAWNQAVSDQASVDPDSERYVRRLNTLVNADIASGRGPWINTHSYSVPVFKPPADQPRVRVILDRSEGYLDPLRAQFADVPIPPDAKPAAGQDANLVIWQPSSDTIWEFFKAQKRSDGWHASWGGRIVNASSSPGYYQGNDRFFGVSASGLSIAGGLITPEELYRGRIDHALALSLPEIRAGWWTWPANRTGGKSTSPDAIPEGAHFRLDPNVDVNSLDVPRATKIMAKAAQRYGFIVRDISTNVTLYARDITSSGTNPYPDLLGTQYPIEILKQLPWSRMQLLPMRPSSVTR